MTAQDPTARLLTATADLHAAGLKMKASDDLMVKLDQEAGRFRARLDEAVEERNRVKAEWSAAQTAYLNAL